MVTDKDNFMLTKLPTIDEVRSTVFSMNGEGSPGPVGFGGNFLSNSLGLCWSRCS